MIRIAAIVAIIAALGSLFFTKKLANQKAAQQSEIGRLDGALKSTTAKLQTTEQNLQQTSATLAQTQSALDKANADLKATEVTLAQKKQEAESLKADLAEKDQRLKVAEQKMAAMEANFKKVQQAMRDAGVEDIGNIEQIRIKLEAQSEENKVLAAQLARLRDDNAALQKRVEELTFVPTGLRGRVEVVDNRWNFVVLDLGRNDRVQPKTEFLVYRDSKMIAKVQVVSVGNTTSVAEILPEYQRGTPQPGDLAVH